MQYFGTVAAVSSSNSGPSADSEKARARHDQAYKAIFGFLLALRDLLRGFGPELIEGGAEWIDRFDFERAERMSTEQITPDLAARLSDMVWRVPFRHAAGRVEHVYVVVLLEFQSQVDRFMALRVQSATVRLYESLRKDGRARGAEWVVPVLAIVVYNGQPRWNAPTRMGGLVRPGTRPEAGARQCPPTFTGDSYAVLDIGAYEGRELPPDNVVSVVMRTELMEGLEEAGGVFEEAWRHLERPGLRDLRQQYLEWFKLLLQRQGVDWQALGDEMEITKLATAGELRTTLDERVRATYAAVEAKGLERGLEQGLERGLEQGLERQRETLRRLAKRRFGLETADNLARCLASMGEHEQLLTVSDWILDCTSGAELLDRVEAAL